MSEVWTDERPLLMLLACRNACTMYNMNGPDMRIRTTSVWFCDYISRATLAQPRLAFYYNPSNRRSPR